MATLEEKEFLLHEIIEPLQAVIHRQSISLSAEQHSDIASINAIYNRLLAMEPQQIDFSVEYDLLKAIEIRIRHRAVVMKTNKIQKKKIRQITR
jgi:hypothetical protein